MQKAPLFSFLLLPLLGLGYAVVVIRTGTQQLRPHLSGQGVGLLSCLSKVKLIWLHLSPTRSPCFSPHFIELRENLMDQLDFRDWHQQSAHHARYQVDWHHSEYPSSTFFFFSFTIRYVAKKKKSKETSRTTFTTECGNTLWFRLAIQSSFMQD
jgi:hypothetical protein